MINIYNLTIVRRVFSVYILTFLFLLGSGDAVGQQVRDQQQLLRWSQEQSRIFQNEKSEAIRIADSLGLLINKVFEDGRVIELMRFENGLPVYYTTDNEDGASLIFSDNVFPGGEAGIGLTGAGQILGIWDQGKVRESHQELTGRITQIGEVRSLSNHATHVAGTMIGAGVKNGARGMSFEAELHAWDWNNDAAEMAEAAAGGLNVSQHSYGIISGWAYGNYSGENGWHWFGDVSVSDTEDYLYGFYNKNARQWDKIAYEAPHYLIVRSAGNERGRGPVAGTEHYVYKADSPGAVGWVTSTAIRDKDGGNDGYDVISHQGTSKNLLTVGAVRSDLTMPSFSAWGPVDDGRIKPDLVAKGVFVYSSTASGDSTYSYYSGTSMAGPMVSGSIGLLLQHQESLHPDHQLLSSSVKALVLHGARALPDQSPGPDYRYGWGIMDTEKSAAIMTQNEASDGLHIYEETLSDGGEFVLEVHASGNEPLRATLSWTDLPGEPVSPQLNPKDLMLVNDLDMRIRNEEASETWMPYILDPDNPENPATTGDNFRDNMEMIHIENTEPGNTYTLSVSHKGSLEGGEQIFSLVVTGNMSPYAVAAPLDLTAKALAEDEIGVSWEPNPDNDDVLLLWNTESKFGVPEDGTGYNTGDRINGGGEVLYFGNETTLNHPGLEASATYYYKAFSADNNLVYSSGVTASATTDEEVTETPTYSLIYVAGHGGSISGETTQEVAHGEDGSPVEAIPDEWHYFVRWSDGSTENPRTDENVTEDLSVTAEFVKYTYTLTYSAGHGGSISGETTQEVAHGETGASVEAIPDERYYFDGWSDGSTENPRTDEIVTEDFSVTATFKRHTFILTYSAGDGGSISGEVTQDVVRGEDGSPVEAVPDEGHYFESWSDGSTENPRTDENVTEDLSVTAAFEPYTYTLTYNSGGGGYIFGESTQEVAHGEDGSRVEAVPAIGYYFVGWSDGQTTRRRTDRNVTEDIGVTAEFVKDTYTLTYSAGNGGSISGETIQEVAHGEDGSQVEAVPAIGYYFDVWSDGSAANPRMDENITGDLSVTAEFTRVFYTLTFKVFDADSGDDIDNAIVALNGNENEPGVYIFDELAPATYNYTVSHEGHFDVSGEVTMTNADKTLVVEPDKDDTWVTEVEAPDINVFPNPARDITYIESDVPITEIRLINLLGEAVLSAPVDGFNHSVNVSGLHDGIYLLRLSYHTGVKTIRIRVAR